MARRNKRKRSEGFIFPAPFAVALIVMSVLSLCFLWLRVRCETLGQELKTLEVKKATLQRNYLNEEFKWSNCKSPLNIEKALREHGLVMAWPDKNQVVRLAEITGAREFLSKDSTSPAGEASADRIVMNDR